MNQQQNQQVAVVFGTRPEIIKLGPIIEALGSNATVVYTGQHFDENMSDIFFREIGIRTPDIELGVGGRSRASQIAHTIEMMAEHFTTAPPRAVVVQGDTNSTVGAALAANATGIPLIHVEAGLRSFDRNMPEEHNRIIADHVADVLCTPTSTSANNISKESIDRPVYVTGNTVVDVALRLLPTPEVIDTFIDRHRLERGKFYLATFHRPENVDDLDLLAVIFEQLAQLGSPVILPLHPRTAHRLKAAGIMPDRNVVRVIAPVGYIEFLSLASACRCLISDSGGVQEEASVLKKPVAVVRNSTERPEILGTFGELVVDRSTIVERVHELVTPLRLATIADTPSPYGDGDAGRRTVAALIAEGLVDGVPDAG